MAYIVLPIDFFEKDKRLRRLMFRFGGRAAAALPIRLWCLAAQESPRDGRLAEHSTETLEMAVGWTGRRGELEVALIEAGFLEKMPEGYRVPNWDREQGQVWRNHVRASKAARTLHRKRKRPSMLQALLDALLRAKPRAEPRAKLEAQLPAMLRAKIRGDGGGSNDFHKTRRNLDRKSASLPGGSGLGREGLGERPRGRRGILPPNGKSRVEYWHELLAYIDSGYVRKFGRHYPWSNLARKNVWNVARVQSSWRVMALWDLHLESESWWALQTEWSVYGMIRDAGSLAEDPGFERFAVRHEEGLARRRCGHFATPLNVHL